MNIDANGVVVREAGDPPYPSEIEICRQWLQLFAQPTARCGRRSSYGLKHDVEKWAGKYVSNGAFITAAIAEGYRTRTWPGSPNTCFFMSIRKEAGK